MSDTATWINGVSAPRADEKSSAPWRLIALLIAVVLLGLAASLAVYSREMHAASLSAAPSGGTFAVPQAHLTATVLRYFDGWALWLVLGTEAVGAVFLSALLVAVVSWRRSWAQRYETLQQQLQDGERALERQLADSRKVAERLQSARALTDRRLTELEADNAALQAELGKLKKAEKSMAHERQSLESSKAVLEIHVQARTKELQKLQRRYELILNSAGEGICGLDAECRTRFANPAAAKLTGRSLEEMIGLPEQEIFGLNGSAGATAADGRSSEERVIFRKDGTCSTVEYVRTPICENGEVVGAVLMFKDITERKRVEETLAQKAAELARSNTELEQFAFVASHDLQEPLRKIQAFGDRLKAKCSAGVAPEARDYLERMQNAASRMRTLIGDLLTFSRVMRSAQPFVPVDLAVVAKEVLGDLEVRIEKSGAHVEVGDLPSIEADPLQMRQLLMNLIGNGLKFQPAGAKPVVKIQARLVGRSTGTDTAILRQLPPGTPPAPGAEPLCEISVQDNGIGFEEQYAEKIFAVFQRLHGRDEYEGTGVGLAVCRRIAERHHGTIVARGQPGAGATFLVTLPVNQPKPPTS
jgi:PAS domain S-box-containing protein